MSHIRHKPRQISYGGMEFQVGTLKSNGRVDISYKSKEMQTAFTREYVPVSVPPSFEFESPESEGTGLSIATPITLETGAHLPENVIRWTLQEKLPRYFFCALFRSCPGERTGNIHFSLLGEYALVQLHKNFPLAPSTMVDEQDTLYKMIKLWGDHPLVEITPDNVGVDLTEKMSATLATKCTRLLRKIYPAAILGSNSDDTADPFIWTKYKPAGRKTNYSPKRRIRTRLINNPPSPSKIREIVERCIHAIRSDDEADRHLAALIMLIEGIDVEEVCALRADSFKAIVGYQREWYLNIDRLVVSLRNETNGDFVRESRHRIENMLPPERRKLGLSRLVASYWNIYAANHIDFKGNQLLLSNPENRLRVLPPKKFRAWLKRNYGDIIPDTTLIVGETDISTSFEVEDAFWAASKFLLADRGGYSGEELRYHFGLKPAEMDGKHYAGFGTPSELVTQGKMQDKAIFSILGGGCIPNDTSAKQHQAIGQAGCASRIRIEIDVEKMLADNCEYDLMLRLKALGFSQKITFVENEE